MKNIEQTPNWECRLALYPPPGMLPCGRPSRTSMAPFVTKNCPASPWWLKSWNRLKTTPHVEDLPDVTSLEDSQVGVSVIDPVIDPTFLRIKPGKTVASPPTNAEQLRLRLRRIGLTWEMLRKHSARPWLPERCLDGFRSCPTTSSERGSLA